MSHTQPEPEFSFPVDALHLPASGGEYSIAAPADARPRIAQRLGVVAVHDLHGRFTVKPQAGGLVRITGQVHAKVEQRCVVSLVPVTAVIDEDVEASFVTQVPPAKAKEAEDEEVDLVADEPPDLAPGGRIDLGELAVTQVALVLDPYPRAPGVAFEPGISEQAATPAEGPFAALAKLKKPGPG